MVECDLIAYCLLFSFTTINYQYAYLHLNLRINNPIYNMTRVRYNNMCNSANPISDTFNISENLFAQLNDRIPGADTGIFQGGAAI